MMRAPAHALFPPKGVAALGDSLTDPPTGLWPGFLADERGIDFGGAGEPYNLAVSGATAASLLSGDQHTDARALVDQGLVDIAFLWIGGNDVRAPGFALPVANGTLAGAALDAVLDGFFDDIAAAVAEIALANPRGIVLSAAPDVTLTPGALALVPDAAKRARVADAIDALNARLRDHALANDMVFLDDAALQRDVQGAPLVVGGVTIQPGQGGATFLYKDAIHPGAVGQAIVANLRIAALNRAFLAGIAPLTDQEILGLAGLGAQYAGETFARSLADYVEFAPREPRIVCASGGEDGPAWAALLLASAGILLAAKVRGR